MIEGITKDGAKFNICVIYSSDIKEVIPVEKAPFISIEHNELTLPARDDSSPEEYFLKKLAGKDMILIMTAASTDRDVFVDTLFIRIERIAFIIIVETLTQIIKIAIAIKTLTLPELCTGPVNSLVSFGDMKPIWVTTSDTIRISMISEEDIQSFIYLRRSGMPSFFKGNGR